MGWFTKIVDPDNTMGEWREKPKAERQADLNRYRAAKRAGDQAAKKLREECPTTNETNRNIIEAEKEVPKWLRW